MFTGKWLRNMMVFIDVDLFKIKSIGDKQPNGMAWNFNKRWKYLNISSYHLTCEFRCANNTWTGCICHEWNICQGAGCDLQLIIKSLHINSNSLDFISAYMSVMFVCICWVTIIHFSIEILCFDGRILTFSILFQHLNASFNYRIYR